MRICLFSRELPRDTDQRDVSTFVRNLSFSLEEIGHEVVVISLSNSDFNECVRQGKITVYHVAWKNLLNEQQMLLTVMPHTHHILKPASAIWQKFCELHQAKPFDLVEVQELCAEGLFVGLTKAAPLVVRLHPSHIESVNDKLSNAVSDFDHDFVRFINKFTLIAADRVICASREMAENISCKLNYPLSNIEVASEVLDTARLNPEETQSSEYQAIAQRATILYENVIHNYRDKKHFALYQKPVESLLPSAIELMTAFNFMLYNSLYVYSWRFRLNHWFHKIKDRPRLSFAKAVMSTVGSISRLIGRETLPRPFNRLKEQIKLKETNGIF